MSSNAAKIALESAAAAAAKGGQKIDWDGLTKAVRGATKAGDGIDWDGLGKLLVSDTARKEFANLRRAFNDVNQQLQTKFSMVFLIFLLRHQIYMYPGLGSGIGVVVTFLYVEIHASPSELIID